METHQSLALKYRPQTFGAVVGQDHVTSVLKNMVSSRKVSPTIGLFGSPGHGKTTLARLLATYINCEALTPKGLPCRQCRSCKGIASGRGGGLNEMNAASDRGIDTIRNLINSSEFAPIMGKRRFYLLDEAHQLTGDAFKAALKLFEEPPPSTTFILCTSEPQKIPTAVLQRCLQLKLNPVPVQVIVDKLLKKVCAKEGLSLSDDVLDAIAKAADGIPRVSLTILDRVALSVAGDDDLDERQLSAVVRQAASEVGYVSPQKLAVQVAGGLVGRRASIFDITNADRADYVIEAFHGLLVNAYRVKSGLGGQAGMTAKLDSLSAGALASLAVLSERTLSKIKSAGGFSDMNRVWLETFCIEALNIVGPAPEKAKKPAL